MSVALRCSPRLPSRGSRRETRPEIGAMRYPLRNPCSRHRYGGRRDHTGNRCRRCGHVRQTWRQPPKPRGVDMRQEVLQQSERLCQLLAERWNRVVAKEANELAAEIGCCGTREARISRRMRGRLRLLLAPYIVANVVYRYCVPGFAGIFPQNRRETIKFLRDFRVAVERERRLLEHPE